MKKDDNILNNIGNKKPFSVPENYFENFAIEMEKQITAKKEKTVTVPFITKLKPFLYAAAIFALVLTIGNLMTDSSFSFTATENLMEQHDLLLSYLDEDIIIEFLIEHNL